MQKTLIINSRLGERRIALLSGQEPVLFTLLRDHEPSFLGQQHQAKVTKLAPELDGAFISSSQGKLDAFLPKRGLLKTKQEKQQPINKLITEGQVLNIEITRDPITSDNKQAIAKQIDTITNPTQNHFIGQILNKKGYDGVAEIICDDLQLLSQLKKHLKGSKIKITAYKETLDIFENYEVNEKLAEVMEGRITLPSGGHINIEHTKALTAIDVNSGSTHGQTKMSADNALNTNIEAAKAVAQALKFQNIGGLIVVDFVDMTGKKAKQTLEDNIKKHLQADHLHVEVGSLSPFGLLEIKRQKLGESLNEKLMTKNQASKTDSLALELLNQAKKLGETPKAGKIELTASSKVIKWIENHSALTEQLKQETARNLSLKVDDNNNGQVTLI